AVSGNHDVAVLPRLAAVVPGVKLLGQGGVWEVVTLTDATTTVHVAGWSYPSAVVTSSPVPHLVGAMAGLPEARVIGLLHCDRDQPGSRYAPVTSSELGAAPVAVGLLGRVQRRDLGVPAGSGGGGWVRGGQLGGCLGSLSPGDPGEEGPRGAWLVEITADAVGASHVPLAGLRYETLVLDVGGLDDPAVLGPLVVSSVSEFVTGLIAEVPATAVALRALGVRLRLVGRSPVRAELAVRLVHDDPREAVIHVGGVAAFIHDVRLEALPVIDLS